MNPVICEGCRRCDCEIACLCQFPLPLMCNGCYSGHVQKGKDHMMIQLSETRKVDSDEDLHLIRMKLLDIDHAEKILVSNLKTINQCEEDINGHYASLIADIQETQRKHLVILSQMRSTVEQMISQAVACAKAHVIDKSWDNSIGNDLAMVTWNFKVGTDKKPLILFEYQVTRPPAQLDKLMNVQMMAKTAQPKLPDEPFLSIIFENALYRFDVANNSWKSLELSGEILRTWKFSWDSAVAHFDDNIHLLCTGGGNPLTNSVYEVNMMDGRVKELSPMRSSRAGHGLTQFGGKFYAFGGHGSRQSAEMFTPNEDRGVWEPLGNMQSAHSWFTSCVYNNLIYLCGGDSPTVETFNPATRVFAKVAGFELTGDLAESSMSVGVLGDEIVILSSTIIKRHNMANGMDSENNHVRPMRSAWSCMTPIVGKDGKICLPSQESKHVKAVDVMKRTLTESKAPHFLAI